MDDKWPSSPKGYKFIHSLGFGNYGLVWKIKVEEGPNKDKLVALKKIDLERCNDQQLDEIRKEMILLNTLQNPNLHDYKIAFIDNQDLWIINDLMEAGSLELILKSQFKQGIKDQVMIASILKQTLNGLEYLHKNNQIHRDIKAANILLSLEGDVVISDFCLTTKLKKNKKKKTLVGSPCWMSPEILNDAGYDFKADIWSFGITALELAYGKPPYCDLTTMKAIVSIIEHDPPSISKKDGWDDSFIELINCCLHKDPNQRKTSNELQKLAFFKKAKGKEYIKTNLINKIPCLEQRIDQAILKMGFEELQQKQKQTKQENIYIWDFNLSNGTNGQQTDEDQKIEELNYENKQQKNEQNGINKLQIDNKNGQINKNQTQDNDICDDFKNLAETEDDKK